MAPITLQDAIRYFSNFDNCQRTMIDMRWPDGVVRCPTCNSDKVVYLPSGRVWRCSNKHDQRKFSLKVGKIFERHGPDKHSRVKANVVRNVRRDMLQSEIRYHVEPGS